jgi:hypothetical protein
MSLLSKYSLALSLSSIADPVRNKLDATVHHFSYLVALSTITVAVGVLMEGVELAHAIFEWRKRKRREKRERIQLEELRQVFSVSEGKRKLSKSHSEEPTWAKLILRVGLILVAIGVVGEWRYGGKLEDAHDAVHQYDLGKILEANQKAGEAAVSAKTAHDEADAVKLETDAIQNRLDAASKQLGIIEKQVRVQGPRWKILADNKDRFIRDLKPFSPAKITILICGQGVSPTEQLGTEQRLLNLLGKPGPNWTAANWETGYEKWSMCPNTSSNGLQMTISGSAGDGLKKAATALKDELLGLGISAGLHIVPAEQWHFWAALGTDSPEARAAQDPTKIFLLVAPNAMVKSAKPSTRLPK